MQFKAKNFISFTIFAFLSVLLYIHVYMCIHIYTRKRRGGAVSVTIVSKKIVHQIIKISKVQREYYLFSRAFLILDNFLFKRIERIFKKWDFKLKRNREISVYFQSGRLIRESAYTEERRRVLISAFYTFDT